MTNAPLITTIIPTYRRSRLLERAIRSVLGQTYPNFEICVYDNASGDETSAIVARLASEDPRVRFYSHRENIGPYANFQFGLARVDTSYFSFLSDDDVLLPDFYKTALQGFERFPDAAFSAGSVIVMTKTGEVLHVPFALWEKDGYFTPPEGVLSTIGQRYPTWTGVLFRKGVVDDIGFLDSEVGVFDLDFVYRIAARHPFVISKKPCAVCVSHPSSWSQIMELHSVWPGWLKMIRNVTEDTQVPMDIRQAFEQRVLVDLEKLIFRIGIKSIEMRRYEQAKEAATILQDFFKSPIRAQCVVAAANGCEHSTTIRKSFAPCLSILRKTIGMLRRDRVYLQKEYGYLSSWLG